MEKKIFCVWMLSIILVSMLNVTFTVKLSLAETDRNKIFTYDIGKNGEAFSSSSDFASTKSNNLNVDWQRIFERNIQQKKTVENCVQNSINNENNLSFNDVSKWDKFVQLDGNKTRLIFGVNGKSAKIIPELKNIAEKHKATIVNSISTKGEIKAVVVEISLASVTAFIEETRTMELVSYIEPSMKVQAQLIPNDPYWSLQWGPQKIGADWAWNTIMGTHEILVAVIDTGIYYYHEDLAANYVALGYDWVNDDPDPLDDHGHGTHCAGIIAATINNRIGIAGLAQVRIMAEKVLDSQGYGYWDWVANGIIHATDSGAHIISLSLGGYGYSELVHEAVKYAYDNGVLIIAASGNDNTNMKLYPAGYDEVIAVAATDQYDYKAWWSNWGDWIELAAPGVDIYSTVPWGYESWSGTSMACPHVSGVAALIYSLYPDKIRDWVRLWLRYTADDLGDPGVDFYFGYGRINARKAVEEAPPAHELIAYEWATPPYVEPRASATINATVLNFGENNETGIEVQLSANGTIVDSALIGLLASGDSTTVSLTWNPTVEGLYNITLYVVPEPGEISIKNNVLCKYIYVGTPIKAVVLHSAGNVYDEIITNWQVLNSEWRLFGDTMVYIDYTTLNKKDITYEDIAATKADVLIISCAYNPYEGWEFTDSEIEAITRYIYEGHGLIATAGTFYYYVPNNNKLAPLFGLNEAVIWYSTGTDLLHLINATHPLFANIPNPFVFPQVGTALPNDGRWDPNELIDGKYFALGHYQESAIVVRRGLVYISPWLEVIPPYYHHHLQLLYNAIIWSCYQKPEHELVASLETPIHLQPGDSALLNATVTNFGRSNETNVELRLLINSVTVDSVIIHELLAGASYKLSHLWAPTIIDIYNITAYAPPVLDEEFIGNNIASKMVKVSYEPRILVVDGPLPEDTGALERIGYTYTSVSPAKFATVDLYEFNILFVGWEPSDTVVNALLARASEIANWVASGNGIVALSEYQEVNRWAWLPLKVSSYGAFHADIVHILNPTHPVMCDLTDTELSRWSNSYHGYFISYDPAWEALAQGVEAGRPITLAATYGGGRIVITHQDPDWHLYYEYERGAEKLLRNMIEWVNIHVQYEHDLIVRLEAPSFLIPGNSVTLNATVFNEGLRNETNVELQLLINGTIIESQFVPELSNGASHTITYLWTPTEKGTYNITAYALPVENEAIIANNIAKKFVKVMYPLISPREGQYANYMIFQIDPSTGEERRGLWNFTYLSYISPYQINITAWMRDPYGSTMRGWMVVNTFTRMVEKDSGIGWSGMWYPGWIETNVTMGSTINLLWSNATIVDTIVILVGDTPIDCWKIELYYGWVYSFWYDKASGLWIGMEATSPYGSVYLILTATNVPIGFMYEHDIAVMLDAPARLQPETSTIFNATVYNIGLSNETNVTIELIINGALKASATIPELASGNFYTLSYPWTPIAEGIYNVTVYALPLAGEEYLENNVRKLMVNVQLVLVALISDHSELTDITYILDSMGVIYDVYNNNNVYLYTANLALLLNYKIVVFYTDYRWITLQEQKTLNSYLSFGGNLVVTGFDCLVSDTRLADVVRSATIGDNAGRPDLYVVNEAHPIVNGPYGSFQKGYHVKDLFGDCDIAKADTARGAVTVAELGDGYDKILATNGLPGKVVFWNGRGDYDWTFSVECQVMFKNMIFWMTVKPEHDLAVALKAPNSLPPGQTAIINATVCNHGSNSETDVTLYLLINGVVVRTETIPELGIDESCTINYTWSPTIEGMYNVTAYAPPVIGEEVTANNAVTKMVSVGLPSGVTIVYVAPSHIDMTVGETFTVNVNVANITDLYGYEFKLFYRNDILSCVNVTLPPGHFLEPTKPENLFILKLEYNNTYNATHGRIWAAMTLLYPETPKTGSGVLITAKFQAISMGESLLKLFGTEFVDSKASSITHLALDGRVTVRAPEAIRDVALTQVIPSLNETYKGWIIQIFVAAVNLGDLSETFDVTAYYGSHPITTQTIINLAPGQETVLTFNWNTSGAEPYINYTIWAEATSVSGETNLNNNICINGTVMVKMLGDINGDRIVDIRDVVLVALAFGTQPGDSRWNTNADMNQDGIINIFDIVKVAVNLGLQY